MTELKPCPFCGGEAETHKTVQEVKAYYKDKDADKVQETRVNVGCGGAK